MHDFLVFPYPNENSKGESIMPILTSQIVWNVMLSGILSLAAWRWGDWRHWRRYHATILYVVVCDLLYNVLAYNHRLWVYQPNHIGINLVAMFINYPCTMLLYLPHYPNGHRRKQLLYIAFWVVIWSVIEAIYRAIDGITYQNGWTFWYSVEFDVLMFIMSRLHLQRPLLTYILSVPITCVMLFTYVPLRSIR